MGALPTTKKIGVFGHVGNQNMGDEAILASVIQNVRYRCPGAEIFGFTLNPDDSQARHTIRTFPIRRPARATSGRRQLGNCGAGASQLHQERGILQRIKIGLKKISWFYTFAKGVQTALCSAWSVLEEARFLIACYWNLKGLDLLIIAGSQQLNDFFGGTWAFPYTLLKWSILARLTNTKVAFLSVGAGPISAPLSRCFIKWSLSWACYHSYRDETSRRLIEEIGVRGENLVVPDLVHSLQISAPPPRSSRSSPLPVVGINPLPFFDGNYWYVDKPLVYEDYVQKLARFTEWLSQRGYAILFFPTQLRVDPGVISDVRRVMNGNGRARCMQQVVDRPVHSLDDLVSAIAETDIVVANRYHGILISLLLNKPVLGIAYHRKSQELMAMVGQSPYALDADGCDLESLKERFVSLESRSGQVEEEIRNKMPALRQAVAAQYQRVLSVLEQPLESRPPRGEIG